MTKRYFELNDDMSRPDRWLLGDPIDEQQKEVRPRAALRTNRRGARLPRQQATRGVTRAAEVM